jgi:hypothetical protein
VYVTTDDPLTDKPGRLTVLSGPSGVGKSTVVATLRREHPDVWLSVSATTRHPRPGERDGVHYYFVTRDQFMAMVEDGMLLEWADYAGNLYGTPRAPVERRLAAGQHALLEIDLCGPPNRTPSWCSWPLRRANTCSSGCPAGAPRTSRPYGVGWSWPKSSWPPWVSSMS